MSVTYLKTLLENFQGFPQFLTVTLKQTVVLTTWQTCSMFYSVVNIFNTEAHLKFFGSHMSSPEGRKIDVNSVNV